MFSKNGLFALALAAGALVVTSAPARAIPLPPPGDSLFVTAYYSDAAKTQLVGQKWSGCGQPSGSWGTTTQYFNIFWPAC